MKKQNMKLQWDGKFLHVRRKQLGLTAEELSRQVGCKRPLISMWEANKASPTGHFLVLLATVLKVEPKVFYKIPTGGDPTKGQALEGT